MESIIVWVSAHWSDILAVIGAVVSAATVIVKVTPSQADDAVLAKVVKVLDYFSVVNPKAPKG
jgi:hypothetical protein